MSMGRARRSWLQALAVAGGLLIAAAIAEVAFRCCWPLPAWFAEFQQAGMYVDAGNGHVALRPGYRGTLEVEGRTTTVAISSAGLRGPELRSKQPGERRVLVVGDSLVWGYGVEVDEALPARLEVALRDAGCGSAVTLNAGVPGYGSKHMAAHLGRLWRRLDADVAVVCGYLGNDAMDDVIPERTVYAGLMLQGAWARLVRDSWRARLMYRSRAWLWVEAFLHTNRPDWSLAQQLTFLPEEADPFAGFPPQRAAVMGLFLDVADAGTCWQPGAPPVIPRLLGLLRDSLASCQRTVGDRPLVFVVLPTRWQVLESEWRERLTGFGFDPARFERGRAQQRWLDVARQLGILAFDATPVLAADADPAGLFLQDAGHFSVRGNEVVARWLAQQLAPLLR